MNINPPTPQESKYSHHEEGRLQYRHLLQPDDLHRPKTSKNIIKTKKKKHKMISNIALVNIG